MQIAQLQLPSPTARPTQDRAAGAAAAAAPASAAAADSATPAPVLRGPRRDRDQPSNRHTAGAQQTLNYLNQLGQRLQQLKSDLSRRLADSASQAADDEALLASMREAATAWDAREAETAGHLDGQLNYSSEGDSRRRFSVRGVTAESLSRGARETLAFTTGSGRRPLPVTVEAGATLDDTVRRLDRAMAPADVRVSLDEQGEPVFSVAEAQWPALRDSLTVKGGGIRFPAGAPHRVRAEAKSEAIQPQHWQTGDVSALRSALSEVTQALEHIRQVAESVRQSLDKTAATADSGTMEDLAWAQGVAGGFAAAASQPGFQTYATLAPALAGVNRSRVMSLLSLD